MCILRLQNKKPLMLLAIFGPFQLIIALVLLCSLVFSIYLLVQLFRSNVSTLGKIMYTILLFTLPVLGMLLVYLLVVKNVKLDFSAAE